MRTSRLLVSLGRRLATAEDAPAAVEGCARALAAASIMQAQGSSGGSGSGASSRPAAAAFAALAAAATVASQLCPQRTECAAAPGAAHPYQPASPAEQQQGWLGWAASWLPWGRGDGAQEQNPYFEAMQQDPRVAVVMAYALPHLSLAFGYTPSQADMDAAGKIVEPYLQDLRPWELSVLLWGAARLGYTPGPVLLRKLQDQAAAILREAPGSAEAFSPQEACMAAWALSVLQGQTPELWASALKFVSACPSASLDEVALIHLYQAAMFADRATVTALGPVGGPAAAVTSPMRSASDEVRATLAAGGCPLPLIACAEQAFRAGSRQAGFDGPLIVELSMLRMLITIYKELGSTYGHYLEDMHQLDLQHAQQLLDDPYLLAKFKSEIADKRGRQTDFTRTLADVSRTMRDMGLYHTVQQPVEDGLVQVDIALPDYKVAFFLEAPPPTASGSRRGDRGEGATHLMNLDTEGSMLAGYVSNETPGTKAAKLRLLQQRGWVVLQLTWIPHTSGEGEKRRLLLQLLDRAGKQQLMRGRVSSMLHGAMRTAEESKLGRERYGTAESAGQNITRGQR